MEAAVAAGRVRDIASLGAFLVGRAHTTGLTAAAFAVATLAAVGHGRAPGLNGDALADLDIELEARTPAPALRAASRKLGRQLLRAARAIRPHPTLDSLAAEFPHGPHQPIILGATAQTFGLSPQATAAAALHEAVVGPAVAATRLLGLDPFAVHAVLVGLGPCLDDLADTAAGCASMTAALLPAPSAPMLDISAQHHATWEVRLFAS